MEGVLKKSMSNKLSSEFNSLQNTDPELALEWSPKNNKRVDEICSNSGQRALWICPTCKGEYSAIIRVRKVGDKICPYCQNKRVLSGYNSLQVKNPELAKEWSPHNDKTADEVLPTSYKNALWVCPRCGGEYTASIRNRKVGDHLCPYCQNIMILPGYNSLQDTDPELAQEWSHNNEQKACDVFPNSDSYALWKCPICKGEYYENIHRRWMCYMSDYNCCPYCQNIEILPGYNSLQAKNPELAKEWSPLNDKTADEVFPNSEERVLWICPSCHGEYTASIYLRKVGDNACPYCQNKEALPGYNSLQAKNPELAKEWSPRNKKTADEVLPTSNKKAFWICPTCRNEYSAIICSRKVGDNACTYCQSKNNISGGNSLHCHDKKVLPGYNSLQAKNPELAKE